MRDCDRYLCGSCGNEWLVRLRHGDRFGPWATMDVQSDVPMRVNLDRDGAFAFLRWSAGLSARAANAVLLHSDYWADARAYETCV